MSQNKVTYDVNKNKHNPRFVRIIKSVLGRTTNNTTSTPGLEPTLASSLNYIICAINDDLDLVKIIIISVYLKLDTHNHFDKNYTIKFKTNFTGC